MSLKFVPLGVGDAFSRKYYSSSLLLWADGSPILIDCPHPIRKMLWKVRAESGATDIGDIEWVVLTHLHADHVSGVEGYLFYSRFHVGRRGQVAAHPEVLDRLWTGHLSAGMDMLDIDGQKRPMHLDDYAECVALDEAHARRLGHFHIECRRTKHHVPTFALRIFAGDKCLGYSADTSFDPDLIEWLSPSDLIIHETNEGIHTPYEQLAALPETLRKKMRLIHYPDDFDLNASLIAPLRQGMLYTI